MKLIIQVPCYNEEQALGITLDSLPREVSGFEKVEWLIIDDGSTDRTVEVANLYGVDYVVRLPKNQGLAKAFMAGLEASLKAGADIIVNTDADNQYCADDIHKLVEPILSGKAEMVLGSRPILEIERFSFTKKLLQKLGSWAVRAASGTNTPDAPSGFRAISRSAALRLNVFNEYTYTLETIIQAGQKGLAITSVEVGVNEDLRPSRLIKSTTSYVYRSILTIFRIFMTYRPFQFFLVPGLVLFCIGTLIGFRFLFYYFQGFGQGHIQSLILTTILLIMGFQFIMFGLLADLIAVNRKILEDIQWRMRKIDAAKGDK